MNTPEFWNRTIAKSESELARSPIYNDKNKIIFNFLKSKKGKLFNVGIGYGILEKLLQKRNQEISLYGTDISSLAIEKATKTLLGEFYVSDSTKILYKNKNFDFVLMLDVMEHLTETKVDKILIEIKRVIKRNGFLIVSVPLSESKTDSDKNNHLRVYTPSSLKQNLIRHGFEIVEEKYLTAFKTNYKYKSFLNRIFNFRKPNLIIVFARPIKK